MWSDDRMAAYLKHQASLVRKRKLKKRAREPDYDFATACTGGQGSGAVLSDDSGAGSGDVDDLSSAAGSASRDEVDNLGNLCQL